MKPPHIRRITDEGFPGHRLREGGGEGARERNGKRIESRKQQSCKQIGGKQMSKRRIHVVFQVVIPPTEQSLPLRLCSGCCCKAWPMCFQLIDQGEPGGALACAAPLGRAHLYESASLLPSCSLSRSLHPSPPVACTGTQMSCVDGSCTSHVARHLSPGPEARGPGPRIDGPSGGEAERESCGRRGEGGERAGAKGGGGSGLL